MQLVEQNFKIKREYFMSMKYRNRINGLQAKLKELQIDYFILADADPHNSEYVSDYFKMRSVFSGFAGSNGTLLVGQEDAWLWTDGRYFIQAEKELEGSGVDLMRMGDKNVPTINGFLAMDKKDTLVIGFDGSCFMQKAVMDMKRILEAECKECIIYQDGQIAREVLKQCDIEEEGLVCKGREIRVLPEYLRGATTSDRVDAVRQNMAKAGCEVFLSCKLDTNMWLLNIRGEDILYNPVAFSYVLITEDRIVLFVKKEAVTEELKEYAIRENILIENYEEFADRLSLYVKEKKVMTDLTYLNAESYEMIKKSKAEVVDNDGGTALLQAVKTEKEIALIKEIYRKDSAAVCKFLFWLSKQMPGTVTEYDASCKMDALRRELPESKGLSFHTISAYGANAAMMHYETKKDGCAVLEEDNLFLLDSGGQYDGGTTDVTRTIIIGEPTQEMCMHFTMVVRGMLALQNAVFMKGCTGMNLDILAREPMWEAYMDYKCGTGHGIGYMLSVHEGPQAIRMRGVGIAGKTEIVPGMLISDEPGIYLEGQYGIRMENILLCEEVCENNDGIFLHFMPLTYVPVDMRLIEKEAMTPKEWKYLTNYQQKVYEKISPLLTEEERLWLVETTKC